MSPSGASTAPIAPPRISCEGLETHIAIERSKCKACKEEVPAVAAKTWSDKIGWGRATKKPEPIVAKRRDRNIVDIGEIVRRRAEWKKEIESRIARKEERRLDLLREKDNPWT